MSSRMLLFSKRWHEDVERTQRAKKLLLPRLKKIARAAMARLRYRIRDVFGEDFVRRLKAKLRLDEPLASPLLQRLTPKALKASQRRRIFQMIYRRGLWGEDGTGPFFSGVGSRGAAATAYVDCMAELLADCTEKAQRPITVVDLGCGDFAIGRELIARVPSLNYIGGDIVPELIEHHTKAHSTDRVRFQAVDIVAERLPAGDVCLVRQVLQHLSNDDIQHVLPKLEKYRTIYISEGQPMIVEGPVNPDKPAGSGVRFDWRTGRGRGLELDQPPFNCQTRAILSVPASANELIVTVELISIGANRKFSEASPRS
jgi:O-methyltransferase